MTSAFEWVLCPASASRASVNDRNPQGGSRQYSAVVDSSIASLLARVEQDARCRIAPPNGTPTVPSGLVLPADVQAFYEGCSGLELFVSAEFSCSIVSPSRFRHANITRALGPSPDDRSDRWYVVADDGKEPLVVIDLDPARFGRCYDAFHEVYGVVGSMATASKAREGPVGRGLRARANRPDTRPTVALAAARNAHAVGTRPEQPC
jgi:hypothetical protein